MMTQRSIIAPPKLPADVQKTLTAALQKTVSESEGRAFLERAKYENNPLWGAEFAKLVVEIEDTIEKHEDALKKFATR
jgi:tripartite-type tricarboxylate transporter receptor subunit TctC